MGTVEATGSGRMRLAVAAIGFALLALGLGISSAADKAAAKKPAGKAKNKGKAATKTFVARAAGDGNAKAIVKAKLNGSGVPVRLQTVRVINADGACVAYDPVLIEEPIETTYKHPKALKVTARTLRGETFREFGVESSSAGVTTKIDGIFDRNGLEIRFRQVYEKPGPVIPGSRSQITLVCDTNSEFKAGSKSKGKSKPGSGRGR